MARAIRPGLVVALALFTGIVGNDVRGEPCWIWVHSYPASAPTANAVQLYLYLAPDEYIGWLGDCGDYGDPVNDMLACLCPWSACTSGSHPPFDPCFQVEYRQELGLYRVPVCYGDWVGGRLKDLVDTDPTGCWHCGWVEIEQPCADPPPIASTPCYADAYGS